LVIGGGKAGDWAWFWGNGGWFGRENGAWLEGKWGLVGGEMGPTPQAKVEWLGREARVRVGAGGDKGDVSLQAAKG
jgi:hypothetical protein